MKHYDKEKERAQNRKTIINLGIITVFSIVCYIGIILLAKCTLRKELILGVVESVVTILFFLEIFYIFKVENSTGYYECRECHNRFVPTYFTAIVAPHTITKRFLRCPKCNKKTWAKKVMTKE
ncbi:MAG: hypothetical protein J6Y29_00840 [Clostridiales bacterium]|nr:hypothetical protein [Clostridiales bacterium]